MRHSLVCHPDTPARHVTAIEVELSLSGDGAARLAFYTTPGAALALPATAPAHRADELWQHTCFELFAQSGEAGYTEFNLSPSGQWAAYRFDRYRAGMQHLDMPFDPGIGTERQGVTFALEARLPIGDARRIALSAVIEEIDGTKSYWALRHPPGKPDFHHPDGFALQLD